MSVGRSHKRRSHGSFSSLRDVSTDEEEEEEVHRQNEAQNLRISLHQIKNIKPILK
jgi:hypothetical protein